MVEKQTQKINILMRKGFDKILCVSLEVHNSTVTLNDMRSCLYDM